jgi:hypothetical protein
MECEEPKVVCLREGGTPLFIQGGEAVLCLFLARNPRLHYLSMEHQQGVGRPLTKPSRHRLHGAGSRLGLDQPPVVLCLIWIKLVGVSLVSLHKSALEGAFQ